MWVYMLRENGEVLCALKKFKRLVENDSNHKLKTLHIDWGSGLSSKLFTDKVVGHSHPYEAWFDEAPHFEYLRVFDCTTHVKTAKLYIKKLDDRSQNMYFGIEDETKAQKLYNPKHEKIHVIRDVVF